MSPGPTRRTLSFDRVAGIYDRTRGRPPAAERAVTEALVQRLRGGPVLDVGVGTGRIVGPLLVDPSLEVTGVDVALGMMGHARERGARRLVRADVRELPFHDGSFARSMTTHLLHLVAEWPAALLELARVTRDEYLSVLEFERSAPDLGTEYRDAAELRGLALRPPGLPERELVRRLSPERRQGVGHVEYSLPARVEIDAIAARSYRDQWEVPEEIHRTLVDELRRRHSEAELRVVVDLEIASWRPARLAEFARRERG